MSSRSLDSTPFSLIPSTEPTQRPEIVEELSKWNRRKSSRFAPEKFMLSALLERVLAAEAVQNAPTPAQAGPSIAPIFPGSSPSVSSESSSIFSTLPSTRANIENPQESPVYSACIGTPLVSSGVTLDSFLQQTHHSPQFVGSSRRTPRTNNLSLLLEQISCRKSLLIILFTSVNSRPRHNYPISLVPRWTLARHSLPQ